MVFVGALAETAEGSFFPQLEAAHIEKDIIPSAIARFNLVCHDVVNMEPPLRLSMVEP
jgi:hypothetical protein